MLNEETNNTPLTGDESETGMELTPTTNQAVMALANATSALANALTAINYTPTTWVDNMEPDINADNLNNIEQGILQATTAINSAFTAINAINSNLQRYETTSDANQITKNGTYRFSAAGTALNVPFNNHAGIIYDIGTTKRMQICRAYYLWEADNSLFYRVYGDSWSEWQRIALKSDLVWKLIHQIVLTDENQVTYATNNVNANEFLIEYGKENGGQSYGGGTIVLTSESNKPCFYPVYISDTITIGAVYIARDATSLKFQHFKQGNSSNIRIKVFCR